MRWLLLCLMLLAALGAPAQTLPGLPPMEMQPMEMPPIARVMMIADTIDPAKPETAAQAEENLVALGVPFVPAIGALREMKTQEQAEAEARNQPADAHRAAVQAQALDRAHVRLTLGINPPELIRAWLRAQLPPEQVEAANTLPTPVRVIDPHLESAFPQYLFYIVRKPLRPVQRAGRYPAPLAANNLFLVKREAPEGDDLLRVQLITTHTALKNFFLATAEPIIKPNIRMTEEGIVNAMKGYTYVWLRLSQELHNDGLFRFTIPMAVLRAEMSPNKIFPRQWLAYGRAEVVPAGGNSGTIAAILTFSENRFTLIDIVEEVKLTPGARP